MGGIHEDLVDIKTRELCWLQCAQSPWILASISGIAVLSFSHWSRESAIPAQRNKMNWWRDRQLSFSVTWDPSFIVGWPTFSSWLPLPCVISVVLPNVHQIPTIEHAYIHKPLCWQLPCMRSGEEAMNNLYSKQGVLLGKAPQLLV